MNLFPIRFHNKANLRKQNKHGGGFKICIIDKSDMK